MRICWKGLGILNATSLIVELAAMRFSVYDTRRHLDVRRHVIMIGSFGSQKSEKDDAFIHSAMYVQDELRISSCCASRAPVADERERVYHFFRVQKNEAHRCGNHVFRAYVHATSLLSFSPSGSHVMNSNGYCFSQSYE